MGIGRSMRMRKIPNDDPTQPPNVELTPVEARSGMTTGHMRYVLGISLALTVVTMAVILAF